MNLLSLLVLVSPAANVDFDINKTLPEARVVISKDVVIKEIDMNNQDQSDISIAHFLGGAKAYGFHPIRFVIRALSKEQANAILTHVIDRFNASNRINHPDKGQYVFVVGDEATSSEIHEFVQRTDVVKGPLIYLDSGTIKQT